MKKFFAGVLMLLISVSCYAQRFAHYNTGTLYDSFENPSQAAFIPDSSRQFAFNLLPNFNANLYLKGNAQYTLKSRLFLGKYDNSAFTVGEGKFNDVTANVNAYIGMLRMFTSMSGKTEVGLSYQIKGNGRGHVTDETIALFNGIDKFNTNQPYFDLFNNRAFYEAFHQFSINYREKVTHNFAVGAKLSLLSGIGYNNLNVTESELNRNPADQNAATLRLRGTFQSTYVLGQFPRRDLLPFFRSPGAAISLGATYAPKGYIIQANVKDLGAIRWRGGATTYRFNQTRTIRTTTPAQTELDVEDAITGIFESNPRRGSFTKAIVGRADLSVGKKFMLNESINYFPTAVISKLINGSGTAAALVNQVNFSNFSTSLSGIYNEDKLFDLGLQLMYKTPNMDIFIGSEQLTRSFNLYSASRENESAVTNPMSHSGANIYFGFSFKFGKLLERWKNDSYYYDGSEQGPLGCTWKRWNN
ncbi:DUF5723 family protein [Mucilaginibacter aquatilis]|uniref:DUF5723 domain-containing protein n=1 Tax=Mucilaginibacter aquatilis TaxID=1517760 RepID=A0A6I4IAH3_9SPHI|nr:DUF5723 family protein [Mucilaginibacter aquatilis]MVN91937.1 hypothetical protein [Mucilaginibacter aquatilis]